MSSIIDMPIDSGDFVSGVGGDATAVEPSEFGKCIFDGDLLAIFTFDAIVIDFFEIFFVF